VARETDVVYDAEMAEEERVARQNAQVMGTIDSMMGVS
jgi:hypothetical protein